MKYALAIVALVAALSAARGQSDGLGVGTTTIPSQNFPVVPNGKTITMAPLPTVTKERALDDLPAILRELRGCRAEKSSLFGSSADVCRVRAGDLWVSVNGDGELTIFYGAHGEAIIGRGRAVDELLRDLAAHLNECRDADKSMLDALAPYLPSQ